MIWPLLSSCTNVHSRINLVTHTYGLRWSAIIEKHQLNNNGFDLLALTKSLIFRLCHVLIEDFIRESWSVRNGIRQNELLNGLLCLARLVQVCVCVCVCVSLCMGLCNLVQMISLAVLRYECISYLYLGVYIYLHQWQLADLLQNCCKIIS